MTREMKAFLDDLSQKMYGRRWSESIEAGICMRCGGEAKEFRDEAARREFGISGFCQKCQDEVFGMGEER